MISKSCFTYACYIPVQAPEASEKEGGKDTRKDQPASRDSLRSPTMHRPHGPSPEALLHVRVPV